MNILLFVLLYILFQQSASYTPSEDYNLYWDESEEDMSVDQYSPVFSPANDAYLLVGRSLQINCSVPHSQIYQQHNCSVGSNSVPTDQTRNCSYNRSLENFNISRLHILHCNTSSRSSCVTQNTIQLDNRTIAIHRHNITASDTGTYFCQYNNSGKTEDDFYLKVGYKPYGPENITCVAVDLMRLDCSWIKSERDFANPLPVRYSSYFFSSPKYGKFDCPHPGPNSCSIASESTRGENYTFNMFNSYTLYINATNCCSGHITEYEINNKDIVRLSPVIATPVAGSRNITMRMNLTTYTGYSLLELKYIYYEVSYKSEYSENTINFTSSNKTNIKVMLSELIPFTVYTIITRIRGLECKRDCYWSTPVTKTQKTRKTVPDVVPDLLPSCYHRQDGSLYIYVKPIRKRDKYSEDARYQVKVEDTDNSKMCRLFNVSWENTTINVTSLPRNFNYMITIKTINNIGESRKLQTISIPAYNSVKELPWTIVVERSTHNYTIWWKTGIISPTELETITVYWCHGNKNNYLCKGDLNWTIVPSNQTNMTVYGLADKLGGDWMFSVAFQYTDGYSTGMIFSDCYFPSVTDAPKSVQPFNAISISETELEITPLEYCSKQNPSMPLLYAVYYKQNAGNKTSCDRSFANKTVHAQFGTQNITLTNLKPATDYTICLGVISKGGNITSKPLHARTLAALKEKSVALYQIVLGVIGSICLLCVCLIVLLKLRKKWKQPIEFILPQIKFSTYDKVPDHDMAVQLKESSKSEKGSSDSGMASTEILMSECTINNNAYVPRSIPNSWRVTELFDSSTVVSNGVVPGSDIQIPGGKDSAYGHGSVKERSSSDFTISDGYSDVILRSSHTQSSSNSSYNSSHKSKSIFKRPSVQHLFGDANEDQNNGELTSENHITTSDNFKQERTKKWVRSIENLHTHEECSNNECVESDVTTAHRIPGEIVQEYVAVDLEGSVKSGSVGQNTQEINCIDKQCFQQYSGGDNENSEKINHCVENVTNSTIVVVDSEVNSTIYHDKVQALQEGERIDCSAVDSDNYSVVNKHNENKNIIQPISVNGKTGDKLDNAGIDISSFINLPLNTTELTINNTNIQLNVHSKIVNETEESLENITSGISEYLQVDNSSSYPYSSGISDYIQVDESSSRLHSSSTSDNSGKSDPKPPSETDSYYTDVTDTNSTDDSALA